METNSSRPSEAASCLRIEFAPRLLIETEPGYRIFLRNLLDFVFSRRAVRQAQPSELPAFWSNVFVSTGLPWLRFAESFVLHAFFLVAVWGASKAWLLQPRVVPPAALSQRDVIYFPATEYLQPLDTLEWTPRLSKKGDPSFSSQTILSVPPEADNHTQTIITPPNVKLKNDTPLPNVVAWNSVTPVAPISAISRLELPSREESQIIAPPPSIEQATDRRRIDLPEHSVIEPPPDTPARVSMRVMVTPQAAIIEPPPTVHAGIRRPGDMNIASTDVIPPAPQLSIAPQRASYRAAAVNQELAANVVAPPPNTRNAGSLSRTSFRHASDIVPPPPSLQGTGHVRDRIVALNLHPVPEAPAIASGNRRGTFESSPSGRPGASGTPHVEGDTHSGSARNGQGGARSPADLPSGLMIKERPNPGASRGEGQLHSSDTGTLVADLKPLPRVPPAPHRALASVSAPTPEEREVFGDRKFYSMMLSMPNLNSAGGSWLIRFAELKNNIEDGDLTAPEATRKIDPAYPLELMKSQIQGKVTLYAVIHSDGTVGDVRVLNSVDDRLDGYARVALSRWLFRPATRAGMAVDLEAVVTIPFRARAGF